MHYTYFGNGQTSNITVKDEWTGQGDPPAEYLRYHDLALYYASTGSLWLAVNDSWELDQGEPVDYQVSAIREFRYDGAGQRYFTRAWSWNEEDPGDTDDWTPDESAIWTDTVAGLPFGDFESHSGSAVTTELMRYLAGAGLHGQQTLDGENDPIRYFHGNLGGSTMLLTDEAGAPDATPAISYTAFGEPVVWDGQNWQVGGTPDLGTRYLYGGAAAFESGLLLLEGANGDLGLITLDDQGGIWYQNDLGRYIQALRDRGPLETNAYAMGLPVGGLPGPVVDAIRKLIELLGEREALVIVNAIRKYGPEIVKDLVKRYGKDPRVLLTVLRILRSPKSLWLMPFVGGCLGYAAAKAADPYLEEMRRLYRDWTYGGRGGFKPGEFWASDVLGEGAEMALSP